MMNAFHRNIADQLAVESPKMIDMILDMVDYDRVKGQFFFAKDGDNPKNVKGKEIKLTRDPLGCLLCVKGHIFLAHRVAAICVTGRAVRSLVQLKDRGLDIDEGRYSWRNIEIVNRKDITIDARGGIHHKRFIIKE